MAAGWHKKKTVSPGNGASFSWAAPLMGSLSEEEPAWPFEMLSPDGKIMHLSESEDLNALLLLDAPPVRGFYDMGYVDADGDWWWLGLRSLDGKLGLVARPVTREEAADRILREFDTGV